MPFQTGTLPCSFPTAAAPGKEGDAYTICDIAFETKTTRGIVTPKLNYLPKLSPKLENTKRNADDTDRRMIVVENIQHGITNIQVP